MANSPNHVPFSPTSLSCSTITTFSTSSNTPRKHQHGATTAQSSALCCSSLGRSRSKQSNRVDSDPRLNQPTPSYDLLTPEYGAFRLEAVNQESPIYGAMDQPHVQKQLIGAMPPTTLGRKLQGLA